MFDNVPENVRWMRDDGYNYLLPQKIYSYLNHSPNYQLIYNWNNLYLHEITYIPLKDLRKNVLKEKMKP